MNHFLKTSVLATAVAATTLVASLPAASAGERWRHHGHRDRSGDIVAAGVLGLAVGALAAGAANAASQPRYYEPVDPYYAPDYVYAEPRYRYVRRPTPVYVDRYGALEPWTPEWYRYCSDRYRSFNPRSGTFTGYDGLQHFCNAG
ncbi:BA14K family protein [Pseudaminobacter salicylatoxidans]|uniref:BA14K family protein n=1 Tax=Pseudaminobacter salicylatoxidans TaxID=93369 RepID=UPI00031B0A85|nr:BA14K family protein [Pseudaminobacter salicylatoxidans]